jgi:natural product precursor
MKKISLKNVKETLTRKEMRTIAGGYGGTYGCCVMLPAGWSCGYTVQFAQSYYNGGGAGYCCTSC